MKKVLLTALLGIGLLAGGCYDDTAKTFTTDDGKRIIRTYGEKNSIFIQEGKDSVYITLDKYLDKKNLNRYDKETERIKIMKIVNWDRDFKNIEAQ